MSPRRGRHVEIYEGRNGWYFRTKGGNGEITSTSEAYTRYEDAVRGAAALFPSWDMYLRSDGGMERVNDDDDEPEPPEPEPPDAEVEVGVDLDVFSDTEPDRPEAGGLEGT